MLQGLRFIIVLPQLFSPSFIHCYNCQREEGKETLFIRAKYNNSREENSHKPTKNFSGTISLFIDQIDDELLPSHTLTRRGNQYTESLFNTTQAVRKRK